MHLYKHEWNQVCFKKKKSAGRRNCKIKPQFFNNGLNNY